MITDRQRIQSQMARPLVLRLWEALLPLRSVVTFLNTGAHPDDETTGLLTALYRRHGVRIAIACSTRGEGGQNALGGETGDDLAHVRTREMERAAEVLDATVYWFSAQAGDPIRDFGFSKDGDDTLGRWGRDKVLERMVEILRQCRPDIACPTFLDVPGQHGHHRAMTRILIEAVPLAADPNAYPHQIDAGLRPHRVAKLYLPAWSGAGDSYDDDEPPPNATVIVDASGTDPVTGASYAQIAQWSRQFHATQGMGRWIETDELTYPLHRLDEPQAETSLFDGLAMRLRDLGNGATEIASVLADADAAIDAAVEAWPDAHTVERHLGGALSTLETIEVSEALKHRIARKKLELGRAIFIARNARVTARTEEPSIWSGGSTRVGISSSNTKATLRSQSQGWQVREKSEGSWHVTLDPSTPLPMLSPLSFDPLQPAGPIVIDAAIDSFGTKVNVTLPLEEPLATLPALSLEADPGALIVLDNSTSRDIRLRLNAHTDRNRPRPHLAACPGLTVRYHPSETSAMRAGETMDLTVSLDIDGSMPPGLHALSWQIDGEAANLVRRARYPHPGETIRIEPSLQRILRVDCTMEAGTRVAYLGGGNDQVATALGRMGVDVVELIPGQLAGTDLSAFSTIVIGIFAFRSAEGLTDRLALLHDFVLNGGHLLTLYHRPSDHWQPDRTPLAPITIGKPSLRWRVTDEASDVTHLMPEHRLLTHPNRIGDADWQGWVKERGLYFASSWDDAYTALLAMADPGETPLQGSLLTGRFGKGRHTHTSLVLHTQLEALVPGAVRLMANLIAPAGNGL